MLSRFLESGQKFLGRQAIKFKTGKLISNMFMDSVSTLPLLNLLFPKIEDFLLKNKKLGLFYIDIVNFSLIEHIYGSQKCDRILRNVGQLLLQMPLDFFGYRQKVAVSTIGGDDFLVFFEIPEDNSGFVDELTKFHHNLEYHLNRVNAEVILNQRLQVHLGYAEILNQNDQRLESSIYTAIKEATLMAKGTDDLEDNTRRMELQRIIFEKQISIVFQPIVSLRNGQIFGLEALSRGPKNSFFHSPHNLFTYAEKFQMTYQLESLCREKAILTARSQIKDAKLFLNVDPKIMYDPKYQKGKTLQLLQEAGFDSQQVVLELTERSAIIDFQGFREAISNYRKQGYRLAIDDVGSGYSNLQTVAELRPEYIKIDMSLIRDVDIDPTRKALLETFVSFAQRINAKIIAEGIETLEELKTLLEIGVNYGQGFIFSRPTSENIHLNPEAIKMVQQFNLTKGTGNTTNISIRELVSIYKSIPQELTVRQVVKIFNDNPYLYGLVVCNEQKILGLIMRPKLFNTLGTQYGYALFMNRQAGEIMEPNPLIVPEDMSVSKVAQLVASRTDETLDDYIIIASSVAPNCNNYCGVVTVRKLLDTMARIQIEQAKNANPLTGLPGNLLIESEISKRLSENAIFDVLYIDLDNFKCFNDKYGFEHGDKAILLTAEILMAAASKFGSEADLVGHIGGDDFLVLTEPERAEALIKVIINQFDTEMPGLYFQEDRIKGYIMTTNRNGQVQKTPLMSISIAHVSNQHRSITNHLELGEIAAELKKLAKNQPGSCCCKDWRQDIVR